MTYPTTNTAITAIVDGASYPKATDVNPAFADLDGVKTMLGVNGVGWMREGMMYNGVLSVTVSANDLIVALKTRAGTDPSASDPVYIMINGTVRKCIAALSKTLADGTNWFNSGGAELATKEVDYFAYAIWNTTPATDIVDLGFARVPYFNVYSQASGTTTNEKYLAFANASTPTSTDDMVNIARFTAILSAGAGYTWTVPTFTSVNLIQRPTFETRLLSWTPTWTNLTIGNATQVATYKLSTECNFDIDVIFGNTTSIGGDVSHSTPIAGVAFGFMKVAGTLGIRDAGTAQYSGVNLMQSASLINYKTLNAAGTYLSQVSLSSTIPMTWTTSDELHEWAHYGLI